MKLRHIFSKDTDKKTDAILDEVSVIAKKSADSSKRLEKLLKADGVTLQIYIATGGLDRGKHGNS